MNPRMDAAQLTRRPCSPTPSLHPPFMRLGTKSLRILAGICFAWPCSARFQLKTTTSTTGASSTWLRVTLVRKWAAFFSGE